MTGQKPTPDSVLVNEANFNEQDYLASNPDVARAVRQGAIGSGRTHFEKQGCREGRWLVPGSGKFSAAAWMARSISLLKKVLPRSALKPMKDLRRKIHNRSRIRRLEGRLDDLEIQLAQYQIVLRDEANLPPLPPKHLQVRVSGGYTPQFMETARNAVYPDFNRTLQSIGLQLKDFSSILDFGCGCGRTIRAFASLLPGVRLHGIDIDPEAIQWLQQNYARWGEYSVAPHLPPTALPSGIFDFIFGISVFTHLPEDMQFQWLQELARLSKPGGILLLTTHGEASNVDLTAQNRQTLREKGFLYCDFGSDYGGSISLPDFYQSAFHTHDYIRREWSRFFEVLEIRSQGLQNFQDTVLLRRI